MRTRNRPESAARLVEHGDNKDDVRAAIRLVSSDAGGLIRGGRG